MPPADSCSAISWRVFVFPVPVAPATRPWRFMTESGRRTGASGCAAPPSVTAAPRCIAAPSKAYPAAMAAN